MTFCRTGSDALWVPNGFRGAADAVGWGLQFLHALGEAAADALKREILEELGETCRVGPLLLTHELRFVQQGKPRHEVSLVFRVERKRKGAPKSQERDIEFAFFDSNSIETINLKPKSMVDWIWTQSAFWLSE